MKDDMKKELLSEKPLILMFKLSIPAVIGMTVIGLYPLMDGIFAGNIIGQTAMTACGVAIPLTFLNSGVSTLLGVGSASVLSRALGKGDKEKVEKIMGNLIYWVILFSTIITIGGLILAPHFLDLIGAEGEIKNLAIRYIRILFLGSIFVNFTQSSNMVMRGEGLVKRAMTIMGFGALLNIILDPIFMKAMGEYGIEGAALATVTAQITQSIITLYYFKAKSKNVRIGKIGKEKLIYKEMFGIGISAMIMQLFFIVQHALLYKQAFLYGGENAGILMAATMRFYGFSFIPIWGMSQGLQPAIGSNYGARQFGRVRELMKNFCYGSLFLAALFWIPAQIFPEKILKLFNVDENIIKLGVNDFRLFYSVFILYGIMVISITFFQSIGDGKKAGIIVILRQLILFVPAILILPAIFGLKAVWWSGALIDFIMITVGIIMQQKTLVDMKNANFKK